MAIRCLLFAAALTSQCAAISVSTVSEVGHELELKREQTQHSHTKKPKDDNPLGGVLLGCLIWMFIPCAIWNNERIAIKQYKMQLHAERWAITIDEPAKEPIEDMNGRVVYLCGESTCSEQLKDEHFKSVTSENAIKLRRIVQMYQWVEHEHEDDEGRKSYTYSQQWSDMSHTVTRDDSKRNPPFPIPTTARQERGYRASSDAMAGNGGQCVWAEHANVKLGQYYFGDYIIRELQRWEDKKVEANDLNLKSAGASGAVMGSLSFQGEPEESDGYWYWGGKKETIGSVRVRFEELRCGPTSLCGVLTKTETGWTLVPLVRSDGAAESVTAETGLCSCCLRVKELHYDEDTEEQDFREELKSRPVELERHEKKGFKKAKTAAEFKEYQAGDDLDDLCCVGPFGSCLISVLHWIGLEEEFLGVNESSLPLARLMDKEGDAAASRHHMCRGVSCLLLVWASLMIIDPIIRLLNAHWLLTLLGGGLISVIICCCAVCFSFMTCMCVMSTAWLYYRPILAILGFAVVGLCAFCCFYYVSEAEKNKGQEVQFHNAAALFLQVRRAAQNL